jgi:hypothetical protein
MALYVGDVADLLRMPPHPPPRSLASVDSLASFDSLRNKPPLFVGDVSSLLAVQHPAR